MKIIDLTYPMSENDPNLGLPGHPKFEIIPIHRHVQFGRSNSGMSGTMHAGTHVDSPYHFHPDGKPIDQVPLERLFNQGAILDIREYVNPEQEITAEVLEAAAQQQGGRDQLHGKFVIVYTGWLEKVGYGTKDYYSKNPAFNRQSAQWLVDSGITAVGLDCPPDFATPGGPRPGDAPVHRTLLGNEVPIVENLVNLNQLLGGQSFMLCAAPLKIVGCDGALTRAFAIIN